MLHTFPDEGSARGRVVFQPGDVIILLPGCAWPATTIGPQAAWATGVAPFMLFNALKLALVATALPIARRRITKLT